jgi:hypothetical protein
MESGLEKAKGGQAPMTDTEAKSSRMLAWPAGRFNPAIPSAQIGRHTLVERNLFTDDALIDLLDRYPRKRLQAWTMGTDPLRREDFKPVDTTGVSGRDLFSAVQHGRLWYNILRLDLFDRKYRELIDQLYAEMAKDAPGFHPIYLAGTLLLSSPHAQVYYHADGPPTTLFHVSGTKRMWVYPAGDERFVSQVMLEEIFGSAMDEEVPYSPEFDRQAVAYDLQPGDAIWWPQNAPHRIVNLGTLNISLSTRYETEESERRKLVYNANRFLRQKFGLGMKKLSVKETGLSSSAKCLAYRAARRAGVTGRASGYAYTTNLRVDPTAPLGVSVTREMNKPPFSA